MSGTKNLIRVSLEKNQGETISRTLNPSILADILRINLKQQHNGALIVWGPFL